MNPMTRHHTSRRKRGRFCNISLEQSLVWKYCLKLEGCLHNFLLIGPHSDAAEPNSAPKIVTQFLEPSLVLLRRFCFNVRILRMPFNPRNYCCRYSPHSWSLVLCKEWNIEGALLWLLVVETWIVDAEEFSLSAASADPLILGPSPNVTLASPHPAVGGGFE